MTEYNENVRRNWYSPPFYTGPGGYKMCLSVLKNDTIFMLDHISVCVYLMRGEYDDRLVWPFRGDITVQLVNQINSQNHQKLTVTFNDKSSISSCSRVTSAEMAKSGCQAATFCPRRFMQYIMDDCVRFRVTKVLVVS